MCGKDDKCQSVFENGFLPDVHIFCGRPDPDKEGITGYAGPMGAPPWKLTCKQGRQACLHMFPCELAHGKTIPGYWKITGFSKYSVLATMYG